MMELTSRDILRQLRGPLEDFTNEIILQLHRRMSKDGNIDNLDDGETLVYTCGMYQVGVLSVGFTEPPLFPAVTLMVNDDIYRNIGHEFKQVFRNCSESFSRDGKVRVIRLGVEALNWQSDANPYHPLRKYRGPVGSSR